MKTVKVEIPDNTICGFVNYVYQDSEGLCLGTVAIDTKAITEERVECKTRTIT